MLEFRFVLMTFHRIISRINEHAHLRANEQWKAVLFDSIDDLEHARIHAVGAVTGQGFFRKDNGPLILGSKGVSR